MCFMKKIVVRHAFFVLLIVVLEVMATLKAMDNMFYSFAESTQSNSSIWVYLVLGVIGGVFVFVCCRDIFRSKYVLSLLFFLFYFIFNSLCVVPDGSGRILNNCTWVIIAIIGFSLGYKNSDQKAINCIASWVVWISLPFLCLIVFKYSFQDIGGVLVSKDAFFILTFVLPWVFLIKNDKLQIVVLFIFLALGLLSMKRTIIVVMLLSVMCWLNYFLKEKGWGSFKRISVWMICIAIFFIWGSQSVVGEMILGRFVDLGSDGGSGRDSIYGRIVDDIGNYEFVEFVFGKGRASVSELLGVDAHMDVLQILHSLGAFGLGIYLLIYFRCIRLIVCYSGVLGANKQLCRSAYLTFGIFVMMANLNCFIFNPPFITPMMFVLSFQMGVMQKGLQINKCSYVLYPRYIN